ncbi:MAG: hypothetical protein M3R17_15730 [Bacteroidota bacterium]|nr:hypothetical protein [Bacteroidota bacterium]
MDQSGQDEFAEKKRLVRTRLMIWVVIGVLIGTAPLFALNGRYGAFLFVTVPFSTGFCASLLKSLKREHRLREFMFMLIFPAVALLFFFLVLGKEGFICILMATPIVIGFMTLGLVFGYLVQQKVYSKYLALLFVFALNSCTLIYDARNSDFKVSTVESEIIIHSDKEKVWEQLIHHFEFGSSGNFFLAHGISYPVAMEMKNINGCNSLFCKYSNGNIIANIDTLIPGELMHFSFHEAPVSMKETSLYSTVEPKHIRGKILVDYGSFRIVPIGNGDVKVIATSQFRNSLGPHFYWEQWERYLLNQIHQHVLQKIKEKVEVQ